MASALAVAGHGVIALILLLGFFGRAEPELAAAIPVEIAMEEPAAAPPPPVSAPHEQKGLPSTAGGAGRQWWRSAKAARTRWRRSQPGSGRARHAERRRRPRFRRRFLTVLDD